jgi:hypothetical protein
MAAHDTDLAFALLAATQAGATTPNLGKRARRALREGLSVGARVAPPRTRIGTHFI